VYRAQVYRELVYGIYCVHKGARSHWRRVLFFGYYSRFYLITFVPAEIGEFSRIFSRRTVSTGSNNATVAASIVEGFLLNRVVLE